MKTTRIVGLIVGAGLLLTVNQADADWQYTDNKGKTRTVTLKMDVPSEYRNTATQVDGSGYGSNSLVEPGASTVPVVVPEVVVPEGSVVLVPGKMWWTYPEGSPERATAQKEASMKAYSLRQQAGSEKISTGEAYNTSTAACQAVVNNYRRGVTGAKSFKADGNSGLNYGTDAARFEFEKCMSQRGY
jgi:hypothetical protein